MGAFTPASIDQKFGAVPAGPPTDENRMAAAMWERLVPQHPELAALLEQFYEAYVAALLAFEEADEQRALVAYCKILESVASRISREHKRDEINRAAIEAAIHGIAADLKAKLATEMEPADAAKAIRQAQNEIAAVNLESKKQQILRVREMLLLPAEIDSVIARAWKLRSAAASHAGDHPWESDIVVDARILALLYIVQYVASRQALAQGMTLAEAAATQAQDGAPPESGS